MTVGRLFDDGVGLRTGCGEIPILYSSVLNIGKSEHRPGELFDKHRYNPGMNCFQYLITGHR